MQPEDFFISYAHDDAADFALQLHDELEGDGFKAWVDRRDIYPGADWNAIIEKGLRQAIGVLVLLTPGSIASSVCQDEVTLAHNLKLPIIPLRLTPIKNGTPLPPIGHIDLPLLLQRKQWVDFTQDFDQGIAQLRPQLQRIRRESAEIRRLQAEKAELVANRASAPTPSRVDMNINDIDTTIAAKQRLLTEPEKVHEENQRAIDVGIESVLQGRARAEEHARSMKRQRVVGSAPLGINDMFKDRDRERATLNENLLRDGDVRAVSIIGKGGVGKTALACKVLHDLEKDYQNVQGIIYLSAAERANTLTLERIFLDSAKMLGGDAEKTIEALWTNANMPVATKIDRLLNHYTDGRYILLFDNLEDMLDATGKLGSEDLQAFVDAFLRREHGARLLITSREPLNPADDVRRFEKPLPLQEGLPEAYAVELLRDLDTAGELGLRDASETLLKRVAAKTYGFPRALEAVAGILTKEPMLSLESLLNDDRLWGKEVTEKLVDRAQSRLNKDEQMVMQALALYGRPVNETAVRFLLQNVIDETGLDLKAVLNRLARGKYITVNRSTGEITLHPLDKDYNYRQIAEDAKPINGGHVIIVIRVTLETRAADWYAGLRGDPSEWKTIEDLAPALAEFEHRVRAGDYVGAYWVLGAIDYDYLHLWGYTSNLIDMREELRGRLEDESLEMNNLGNLARSYEDVGRYSEALKLVAIALEYYRRIEHRDNEAYSLSAIGILHFFLGRYEDAINPLERALMITREVGNRKRESYCLNGLAINYDNLGQKRRALSLYEEALLISQSLDDQREIPVSMGNIGSLYEEMGLMEKALEYYTKGLTIQKEIRDRPQQSINHYYIGSVQYRLGNYLEAHKHFQTGLKLAQDVGDPRWIINHHFGLSNVAVIQDELTRAFDYINSAFRIIQEIDSPMDLRAIYEGFAELELYRNRLEEAENAILKAREGARPGDYANLHGVIVLRLGKTKTAQLLFQETLDEAARLLGDTSELYRPKYARGLALCGLALVSGDTSYVADAVEAYRAARANCAAPGVVADYLRFFDALAVADTQGFLAPVRAALAGE